MNNILDTPQFHHQRRNATNRSTSPLSFTDAIRGLPKVDPKALKKRVAKKKAAKKVARKKGD